ncbi:hypothetical protein ASPFODRAFT_52985 [Aspergillus luchuensis CBS 106.47]|uniref:Uncharacterized protein n=1 Tax=Aspergillus luchuensis (strain CBS 106.47) TaxID=1137211 RepID=A0A1M3T1Y9_ASPLC|nr:hypothetical protein ASPFODRAFT_52985 [Aspergillus luchuensis CBS 106.47]
MATPPSTDSTTVHALLLPGRSWYDYTDYTSYLNFPTNFIQNDVLLHLPLLAMENESFVSPPPGVSKPSIVAGPGKSGTLNSQHCL